MIFLRLFIAAILLFVCNGQNGKYVFLKTLDKNKFTLLRAKCVYKLSKPTEKVAFDIGFDGPTSNFKSKYADVTGKTGNMYSLINKKTTRRKFSVAFSVQYKGQTRPQGTCYPLKLDEVSTKKSTFGTYSPLSNTFGATILKSWPDNGGRRIEGICMFEVNKKIKANKKNFIIDFRKQVTRYVDWQGKRVEPKGNSGVWFQTKNLYELNKPSLTYKFHATYSGDEQPNVLCSSDLPEFITTTKAPITSTKATVTTTKAPTTTPDTSIKTNEGPSGTTRKVPHSFPATIKSSWNVKDGIRTDAVCRFAVTEVHKPETVFFRIDFGLQVTDFKAYVLKNIQPFGNTGESFFMSNKYWITSDELEATFQATYPKGKTPNIVCNGDLPSAEGLSQVAKSTTKAPTTTTQAPVTTGKSEGSTKESLTTTHAPSTSIMSKATTQPQDGSYNYNEVIKKSIWFYRAQRSGALPVVANDPVPWRGDSALYDGSDVSVDLTGGWYDAGDWVKFNLPISSAVAVLGWGLVQWEDAYKTAGQYNAILDCIRWPLDFFLKCWREDKNELYGQVGNGGIDHSKMMRPEDMTQSNMPRPAYKVTSARGGSDLAGSMAAAFAIGSMAFKEKDAAYSAKLLAAAESLYVFADKYREKYTVEISDAANYYNSNGYKDELVYAAAMLYKATKKTSYLTDAEQKYKQFNFDGITPWAFDWDDKTIATKLLLFEATGKSSYKQGIQNFLKSYSPLGNVQYTPGGLAWRSKWGSLRYTANAAFVALMAADLGIDADNNEKWAKGQIDYMLGDNPRSSSYVVGFGKNPPKQPHHKSSTCQPKPAACNWGIFSDTSKPNAHVLYGALVGGPDSSDNYKDIRTDYVMAEVTCDYNAGFQSAVAGLVHFKNN